MYLRFQRMRGLLDASAYGAECQRLRDWLSAHQDKKPTGRRFWPPGLRAANPPALLGDLAVLVSRPGQALRWVCERRWD